MAGDKVVELTNINSGKTLRIKEDDVVDAQGGHGNLAKLKLIKNADKTYKLQSVHMPSKYIALGENGILRVGEGGKWCDFKMKKNDKGEVAFHSAHTHKYFGFTEKGNFKLFDEVKKACLFKLDKQ